MTWKIPLNKPFFDDAEEQAIKEVLRSGMVSSGKKVEEFEEKVRKYTGAEYAVAVSSCTAGLYLALRCGLETWDSDIITSAFTFPAIHNVANHFNGEMSISNIDVNKKTYNMDTVKLREMIDDDDADRMYALGIVPIHQFGLPCEMDKIRKIIAGMEISVVEDGACALGSKYKGNRIGRRGTVVFSFHGRKIITTGEGGMVVTDDYELYEKILEERQFGRSWDGRFKSTGMNFKMSDIHAVLGIAQMEKLPEILELRKRIALEYWKKIDTPNVMTPNTHVTRDMEPNWQSYVVRLAHTIKRDDVLTKMRTKGIEVQIGSYDNSGGKCKTSAELARTTLALPIWPGMTEDDIGMVVEELNGI